LLLLLLPLRGDGSDGDGLQQQRNRALQRF